MTLKTFFTYKIKKIMLSTLAIVIAFNLYALPRQKDFSFKDCEYKKVAIVIQKDAPKKEFVAADLLLKNLKKAFPNTDFFLSQTPKDAFKYKSLTISKITDAPKLSFTNQENTKNNEISAHNGRVKIKYSSNPINAVGDFLRELGFEFYAPNDDIGTKLPNANAKIKRGKRVYTPTFISRALYPFHHTKVSYNTLEIKNFSELNGNDFTFTSFSHNLSKIFTDEVLQNEPDFQPTLKKYASKKYLQPKFNSVKAVDFASQKTAEFFKKYPKATSYSIGINDSLNFDISIPYDVCAKDRFIAGADSISNTYYTFANAIAKKVAQTNPDKFVGLIAYLPTLRHPDFALEKNIAPVLCIDSSNFFNKDYKNECAKLLKSYTDDGSKLRGIYSYIYGAPFFVPRPITEFEIEFIRLAKNLGYKCYSAELNPIWAYDSFKCWAILKVLNDSQKSYDELRLEYFLEYYEGAGGAVMQFFDIAKSAWENRTDTPKWLGFYMRDTVAELFTPDILNKMELALKKAEFDAKLPQNKKKVAGLRFEFEKTKAFVKNYLAKKELFLLKFKNATPSEIICALKKSEKAKSEFKNIAKKQSPLYQDFPRSTKVTYFSAPTDELIKNVIENGSELEKQEIKQFINPEILNEIEASSINKSKIIYTFNPEKFEGETNLENALGKYFIIKHTASNYPELKIENCENSLSLKASNAFHFEFFKALKLEPNKVFEIDFELNYQREISSEQFLAVSVYNSKNKCVKYKEISIPPLDKRRSDIFKFIFKTPKDASRTVFGIYSRQMTKPIFLKKIEVKEFSN